MGVRRQLAIAFVRRQACGNEVNAIQLKTPAGGAGNSNVGGMGGVGRGGKGGGTAGGACTSNVAEMDGIERAAKERERARGTERLGGNSWGQTSSTPALPAADELKSRASSAPPISSRGASSWVKPWSSSE